MHKWLTLRQVFSPSTFAEYTYTGHGRPNRNGGDHQLKVSTDWNVVQLDAWVVKRIQVVNAKVKQPSDLCKESSDYP